MTKISSLTSLAGGGVDQANDLLTIVDMSETGAARNKKITVAALLGLVTDIAGLLDIQGSTDASGNPNYPAASQGDTYVISVAGKIGGASGTDVEVGDVYFATADNAGGTQAAVGSSWAIVQGNILSGAVGIGVEDEGVSEATGVTVLNFTGTGVTAADAGGGQVDVTIPGGISSFALGDATDVDTAGQATGDVLTYDGAEWVPGSGGVWRLAGTGQTATGVYDFAVDGAKANIDFTGLADYHELMIVGRGLSAANSGRRIIRVSVDNGSSFYAASGDYVSIDAAGVETNQTTFGLHDTDTTSARSLTCRISNTKGAVKYANSNSASGDRLFVASTSDINAIRITNTAGGNITAGTVRVYAR